MPPAGTYLAVADAVTRCTLRRLRPRVARNPLLACAVVAAAFTLPLWSVYVGNNIGELVAQALRADAARLVVNVLLLVALLTGTSLARLLLVAMPAQLRVAPVAIWQLRLAMLSPVLVVALVAALLVLPGFRAVALTAGLTLQTLLGLLSTFTLIVTFVLLVGVVLTHSLARAVSLALPGTAFLAGPLASYASVSLVSNRAPVTLSLGMLLVAAGLGVVALRLGSTFEPQVGSLARQQRQQPSRYGAPWYSVCRRLLRRRELLRQGRVAFASAIAVVASGHFLLELPLSIAAQLASGPVLLLVGALSLSVHGSGQRGAWLWATSPRSMRRNALAHGAGALLLVALLYSIVALPAVLMDADAHLATHALVFSATFTATLLVGCAVPVQPEHGTDTVIAAFLGSLLALALYLGLTRITATFGLSAPGEFLLAAGVTAVAPFLYAAVAEFKEAS